MAAPSPLAQAVRRWVLTGSVAAVTATGAWYGAGLKTKQEYKQVKQKRLEATPAEQIEQLETMRIDIVRKKNALEKKIRELATKKEKQAQSKTTSPGQVK
ncbi:hypothetical protein MBLNU459_g2953t1 [Dothideomycetes sp. NU459]